MLASTQFSGAPFSSTGVNAPASMDGEATASSDASAALTTQISFESAPSAEANVFLAALNSGIVLNGVASASASVTASVSSAIRLNAIVASELTVTGAQLAAFVKLVTSTTSEATATAELSAYTLLAASVSTLTTASSSLETYPQASASVSGGCFGFGGFSTAPFSASSANGEPVVIPAVALVASAAADAQATAGLATQILLAANKYAQANTVVAMLNTGIPLAGAAAATATAFPAFTTYPLSRPAGAILTGVWIPNTGTSVVATIDEIVPSDTDYSSNLTVAVTPDPLVLTLNQPPEPENLVVRTRARGKTSLEQIRAMLTDEADVVIGTSEWQTLTTEFQQYNFHVYTPRPSTRIRLEVRANNWADLPASPLFLDNDPIYLGSDIVSFT